MIDEAIHLPPQVKGPWKIPDGWEWRMLGGTNGVCIINPRRPRLQREASQLVSFVRMEAVDDVSGTITELQTREYGKVKTGFTYFEEEDVLFAKITPSMQNGKSAIARGLIEGLGFGSTEFHVLRSEAGIIPEWIHLFVRRLSFRQEAMQHFQGAVGHKRVPQEFLEQYSIPIPCPNDPALSVRIQRAIAARVESHLAELAEIRALHAAIDRDVAQVMESVLGDVFGQLNESNSDLYHFGNIVDNFDNLRIPVKKSDRKNAIGQYPYYGATGLIDMVDDYIFEGQHLLISEDGANLAVRKYPIAFVVDGKFWVNNHAHIVKAKSITSNEYLSYYIAATDISELVTGSAQPKLNQVNLNKIPVRLPRTKEQQDRIVAYLEAVKQELKEVEHIQTEDHMFLSQVEQSILEQAFHGEL